MYIPKCQTSLKKRWENLLWAFIFLTSFFLPGRQQFRMCTDWKPFCYGFEFRAREKRCAPWQRPKIGVWVPIWCSQDWMKLDEQLTSAYWMKDFVNVCGCPLGCSKWWPGTRRQFRAVEVPTRSLTLHPLVPQEIWPAPICYSTEAELGAELGTLRSYQKKRIAYTLLQLLEIHWKYWYNYGSYDYI